MFIELKEHIKEFYDESLYINVYCKNIINKPNKKVKCLTKSILTLIIALSVILLYLIISMIYQTNIKNYVGLGRYLAFFLVFLLFEIASIKQFLTAKKALNQSLEKERTNDKLKTKFFLNDKIVAYVVEGPKGDKDYELKWKEIKMILVNKYSIAVIPENLDKPKIFISSEYKDTVIAEIKKAEKEKYLVDNSNLYKNK